MASVESGLSCLSSLKEEDNLLYIHPHYKESYRLAIYALLCGGREAYEEFLHAEQISHFLSEDEILFILENAELPDVEEESDGRPIPDELHPSTYFPTESDEEVPDLDLGWPEVRLEDVDTSISLLFHPPRQNTPTIKEVVRKQIQEAKQVVAIAMDIFTDVDIFKEIISATLRGVAVYILLDDSQFQRFHAMSQRVGVNIRDLKNIRVRTVRGQQYQCQSGVKFHGSLEQKFILVDGRTVLYGTYSYTWSFEKLHASMVLVITGQLVCTYEEEFRRLYANSTVPPVLSNERSVQYLREALHSPNSGQLSLHHLHMRARVMHGSHAAALTRGLSVQERLHQSHCPDMGNLVRGHSYGGELQRLNSMTRPRMGTKDMGPPPDRTGPNKRGVGDPLLPNRFTQQHTRHRTLYGPDQHLIPFNSEMSLNKWKMDTYLNDNDAIPDASCDVLSPLISPYSSHTGLNEQQSQLIHSRSRDIKSRLEELRQKRLSQQEYNNLRQSQESLRSMYPTLERPRFMPSSRGPDVRQSLAELEPNTQDTCSLESADPKDSEPNKEGTKKEQLLTAGNRSASYYDVQTGPDRKAMQTYDWNEPLSRTTSAGDLNVKLNEPSLKLSHLPPSGLRTMESLTEIPEEKECSNTHADSCEVGNEEMNSDKSSTPAESQHQDAAKGRVGSAGKLDGSSGSLSPKEGKKSTTKEAKNIPKTLNTSASPEAKITPKENKQEEPPLQRKNSMRTKVHHSLTSDEKKGSKNEEKSLQRKASLRSQNPAESNQPTRVSSRAASPARRPSPVQQTTRSLSRSQNSISGPETEKLKPPFSSQRLSPQRSSKRKTNPAAEQDRGSRSTLDDETMTSYQTRREQAYSRYEYMLSTKNVPLDKSMRTTSMHPSDKDKSSSLNRYESGHPAHHTQSGADNKLGRFMQRVGNLIGKNK